MEAHVSLQPPTYSPTSEFAHVRLRLGTLRGRHTDGLHVFKGVPYAAPPFGEHRFRPPQPVVPWSGVRDALEWGPEPPQLRREDQIKAMVPDPAVFGEDCLNLNVWTPQLAPARLPVMVFIPGGMFEVCSGACYDGARFARHGLVCVTINYRVGPDGFLYFGEGDATTGDANRGLLDQLAALAWVRDHIEAFGGDPTNVTVFGESAGAMSIGTLLSMPRADGLFRRAILESGAAHQVRSPATARRVREHFAKLLGVAPTREAIGRVPMERLIAAQAELDAHLFAHPDGEDRLGNEPWTNLLPWEPVVDGDVVPAEPIERIAAGAGASVRVIVGTNTDDWRLFAVMNGVMDTTDTALRGSVAEHGFRAMASYGLVPQRAFAEYRAANPGATGGDILAAVQTDWWVRVPAMRLADAHALAGGATWMYDFAWRAPAVEGVEFGACHALELPFVFDTLDLGVGQMLGPLLGPRPPQSLADAMHHAWVAFATTGDPGWPRYDRARFTVMRFDTRSAVTSEPHAMERRVWEGVR